jgi:hypothetical protein
MKIFFVLLFLLFTSCITSNAQSTRKVFKQLSAMEGLWKMNTAKGFIYEEWTLKDRNTLSGKSYSIKNEKDTMLLEEVVMKRTKKEIFYTPTVMDQNNRQPIQFKLVEQSGDIFVFENKAHDFPQRIIYEIKNSKNLHARIEGMKNEVFKFSDFIYEKADGIK